jgi:hypothetical protein
MVCAWVKRAKTKANRKAVAILFAGEWFVLVKVHLATTAQLYGMDA